MDCYHDFGMRGRRHSADDLRERRKRQKQTEREFWSTVRSRAPRRGRR